MPIATSLVAFDGSTQAIAEASLSMARGRTRPRTKEPLMSKTGLTLPLPCLLALTLVSLNTSRLRAEDSQSSIILSTTNSSIIQVDQSILPSLFTPMSHLVATQLLESTSIQANSLGTPRAAVVSAVITHHKTSTNQLNTEEQAPAGRVELPRAKDFTPTTPISMSDQQAMATSTSFAMVGR